MILRSIKVNDIGYIVLTLELEKTGGMIGLALGRSLFYFEGTRTNSYYTLSIEKIISILMEE